MKSFAFNAITLIFSSYASPLSATTLHSMSADLQHIAKVCKNAGGILAILYFHMDNVNLSGSGLQTGDLDFIDESKIWMLKHRRNSAQYSENDKDGKGGISWTQTLSAEVPRARLSVEDVIRKVGNQRIGVLYVDRNGFKRYLLGMKLRTKYGSGKKRSDVNGYEFRFTKETTKENDYIAGAIDVDIYQGGDIGNTDTGTPITDKYLNVTMSGSTLNLPFLLPSSDAILRTKLFIFRDTRKLALNQEYGYTRTGSTLNFDDPLDDETLEIIYLA